MNKHDHPDYEAAKQGDVEAQYRLGEAYFEGDGVPQDYAKAAELWTKAVNQGQHPKARNRLGWMYEKGLGVPQHWKNAVDLYKAAVSQHVAEAQCNLGRLHYEGELVDRGLVEAERLYRLAANQGLVEAQYRLGMMNLEGDGNPIEGYTWLSIAAASGHEKAAEARERAVGCLPPDHLPKVQNDTLELYAEIQQRIRQKKANKP